MGQAQPLATVMAGAGNCNLLPATREVNLPHTITIQVSLWWPFSLPELGYCGCPYWDVQEVAVLKHQRPDCRPDERPVCGMQL